MERSIAYRCGYKFQLARTYVHETGIAIAAPVESEFLAMTCAGVLTIRAGYAWDGPSGPVPPTTDFLRGSLIHDALYQLGREGLLPATVRHAADRLLREICIEDGMPLMYAEIVFQAVSAFGARYFDPTTAHLVLIAPAGPVAYASAGDQPVL